MTTRADALRTIWTAPALNRGPRWELVANAALWPVAILLFTHRIVALALPGTITDDFTTVWAAARRFVARVPVYSENYTTVDPHYLYNPGATLLLSPLGLFGSTEIIRPLFILVNALAILGALAWLTRLSGFTLTHPVFPGAIALGFATEAVTNTLTFSNINGILLLGLVAFLAFLLRGPSLAAGVVLGLCILIKPMFAPLIVLPLLRMNWGAVIAAGLVPVIFNVIAWPLTPGARDYIDVVVPYLGITRDYANSSLAGAAVYFGMPAWLHGGLFMIFAAAVLVAVVGLARWRWSDEWMWAATTAAVLLAGVCLLSSLGQAYYSMMLFPAVFTVARATSVFHTPTAWLGIILCLSPLSWVVYDNPVIGRWTNTFLPTAGWAIFIIATAVWAATLALHRATGSSVNEDNDADGGTQHHDTEQLQRLD